VATDVNSRDASGTVGHGVEAPPADVIPHDDSRDEREEQDCPDRGFPPMRVCWRTRLVEVT
jgi:hypothetical protein